MTLLSAHNASKVIELPKGMTYEERLAAVKALRETCPGKAHAAWKAPSGHPEPADPVLRAEVARMSDLRLPRHAPADSAKAVSTSGGPSCLRPELLNGVCHKPQQRTWCRLRYDGKAANEAVTNGSIEILSKG